MAWQWSKARREEEEEEEGQTKIKWALGKMGTKTKAKDKLSGS